MKLLTEPRLIKKITEPKKRVYKKKIVDGEKPKYTILGQQENDKIRKLLDLYNIDPFKARVVYFNDNTGYSFSRVVLFEYSDGSFQICNFMVSFGISVTNKMYSSQKKVSSISFKNNKFWVVSQNSKTIFPLTYGYLNQFSYECCINGGDVIRDFFHKRYPWTKVISENTIFYLLSFSTLLANKLTSANDMKRYLYKQPINVCKVLEDSRFGSDYKSLKQFKEMTKVMDGIEFLTLKMLNENIFIDTCKMARTLGRKVNCRWGLKRLKAEHDKWAKEISYILLESVPEYDLSIKPLYVKFGEFSGYTLLITNKEVLNEGIIQNHCVGTYIDKVNRGESAIYSVDGHTLELGISYSGDGLLIRQLKGWGNESAPKELAEKIKETLSRFNDKENDKVPLTKILEQKKVYDIFDDLDLF